MGIQTPRVSNYLRKPFACNLYNVTGHNGRKLISNRTCQLHSPYHFDSRSVHKLSRKFFFWQTIVCRLSRYIAFTIRCCIEKSSQLDVLLACFALELLGLFNNPQETYYDLWQRITKKAFQLIFSRNNSCKLSLSAFVTVCL